MLLWSDKTLADLPVYQPLRTPTRHWWLERLPVHEWVFPSESSCAPYVCEQLEPAATADGGGVAWRLLGRSRFQKKMWECTITRIRAFGDYSTCKGLFLSKLKDFYLFYSGRIIFGKFIVGLFLNAFYTLTNAGLFQPVVGYNLDRPNYWVKFTKCSYLTQPWVEMNHHWEI